MKRDTQVPKCFVSCVWPIAHFPKSLSGSQGSTGPEAVNSHLHSGSAIYWLALNPWARYWPHPWSGESHPHPPSSETCYKYKLNKIIKIFCLKMEDMQSIKVVFLFLTAHPNPDIMEGFSFGGSPHPILCGLLCRGKVISIHLLLSFSGKNRYHSQHMPVF